MIGHDSRVEKHSSLLWNFNVFGNVVVKEGALLRDEFTVIQEINVESRSIIDAGNIFIRFISGGVIQ